MEILIGVGIVVLLVIIVLFIIYMRTPFVEEDPWKLYVYKTIPGVGTRESAIKWAYAMFHDKRFRFHTLNVFSPPAEVHEENTEEEFAQMCEQAYVLFMSLYFEEGGHVSFYLDLDPTPTLRSYSYDRYIRKFEEMLGLPRVEGELFSKIVPKGKQQILIYKKREEKERRK